MLISIYEKANYSAKSKDDKITLSRLTSYPNTPTTKEVANIDSLIELITSYSWSPSIFNGVRHNDNFISADFMAIDVDNGMKIEEAERIVQKLGVAALCLPSSSHTPELHKYRLVFPLVKTIYTKKVFDATWDYLLGMFPALDPSCSDYARQYIRSSMDDGFYQDGEFLMPVEPQEEEYPQYNVSDVQIEVTEDIQKLVEDLFGKNKRTVSESVDFFLKNAHTGLSGIWTNSLNAAVFSLSLSGLEEDVIMSVIEQIAPNPLDKKDIYQIKRSCKDGSRKRV